MTTQVVDAMKLVIESIRDDHHLTENPRLATLDGLARVTATSFLRTGLLTPDEAALVSASIDHAKDNLSIGTP